MTKQFTKEELKKMYLEDTRDILTGYDGERTVEGLKGLIDETHERLTKYLNDDIQDDDLPVKF